MPSFQILFRFILYNLSKINLYPKIYLKTFFDFSLQINFNFIFKKFLIKMLLIISQKYLKFRNFRIIFKIIINFIVGFFLILFPIM